MLREVLVVVAPHRKEPVKRLMLLREVPMAMGLLDRVAAMLREVLVVILLMPFKDQATDMGHLDKVLARQLQMATMRLHRVREQAMDMVLLNRMTVREITLGMPMSSVLKGVLTAMVPLASKLKVVIVTTKPLA